MNSGIYKITNTVNGHQYVGSAVNLDKRQYEHLRTLRGNSHYNIYLQRAWNKYGEDAFEFHVVGKCSPERLIDLEQEVIDHLKPEYNLAPTAGSQLGWVHSIESRRKMSESHKGQTPSNKKKSPSEETRKKMSESQRRRKPISNETRRKLSIAAKGNIRRLGCEPWNKGKKVTSEETLRKMSEVQKGKTLSAEHRQKISDAHKRRQKISKLGESHLSQGTESPTNNGAGGISRGI